MRDGATVIGLALLARHRRGPARVLEAAGIEPGDYWDVLAAPGRRAEAAGAVAAALAANAGHWDAWIVRCLPPDAPLEPALGRAGLRSLVRPRIPSPALSLPGDFDDYLATLSSSRRQNLRRHLRRLDGGEIELREVTDTAELPAVIERWRGFRERQWDAAGRVINPAHLAPHFAAFVADACAHLVPEGRAQVWEFSDAGRVIGVYVNFLDAHAYHWYLGGFDPACKSVGLGKIAIAHGIRTSIESGRATYDFGRGAEPYKYWYGAQDRLLAARVTGSRTVASRATLLGAGAQLALRDRRAS